MLFGQAVHFDALQSGRYTASDRFSG